MKKVRRRRDLCSGAVYPYVGWLAAG
jgi:hypothetical protein